MKISLKIISILISVFLFWSLSEAKAQNIGINGSGALAHPSALLDVDAISTPSLGILIPRIALQAVNLAAPVSSPATSLLVYNTAVASTGTNAISAGYYYWDGAKWVRFNTGSSSDWSITGNTGTIDGTNFIGTVDNTPFNIRVNNQKSGRIDPTLGNVFLGQYAGNANVNGNSIVAIGQSALQSNTSGIYNIAIGSNAMSANTSGGFNTAIGIRALTTNNGSTNVGIGVDALRFNTTGSGNTVVGVNANQNNTTGNYNSVLGNGALDNNLTGQRNVAIGLSAGSSTANTIGSDNTFIGSLATTLTDNLTNATAIGFSAKVGQANALILGGTGMYAVNVGIGTATPANRFTIETGDMQLGEVMPVTGLGRKLFFSDIFNSSDPIYFQRENILLDNSQLNLILGDNIDGSDKFNVKNSVGNPFLTVQNDGKLGIGTATPNSNLQVNGSVSASIVRVTGNYTALSTDYTIVFNTSALATLTLPAASTCVGRIYNIVSRNGYNINFSLPLVGSGGSTTTISQFLSGGGGYSAGDKVIIQSDGTDWIIISW